MRRTLLLSLALSILGCRGSFDLAGYLVGEGESETAGPGESGTTEAPETGTGEGEATATSGTETDGSETAGTETAGTETAGTTGGECAPGELDLGRRCLALTSELQLDTAPTDLSLADFDGNETTDVLVAGSPATLRLNNGTGEFGDADDILGAGGTHLEAADFDPDGFSEAVFFTGSGIQVAANSANTLVVVDTLPTGAYDGVFLDIDGDTDLDLISSGPELALHTLANGTYTTVATLMTAGQELAPIDLDEDGQLDLLMTDPSNSALVRVALANGGFGAVASTPIEVSASDVAILDRDGIERVLVTDTGGNLRVFDRDLQLLDIVAVGVEPRRIATGDLDGDGLDDVVISDGEGHAIIVLLATGSSLGDPLTFATGDDLDYPEAVGLADLDGDGLDDIVVGAIISNRLLVVR